MRYEQRKHMDPNLADSMHLRPGLSSLQQSFSATDVEETKSFFRIDALDHYPGRAITLALQLMISGFTNLQ